MRRHEVKLSAMLSQYFCLYHKFLLNQSLTFFFPTISMLGGLSSSSYKILCQTPLAMLPNNYNDTPRTLSSGVYNYSKSLTQPNNSLKSSTGTLILLMNILIVNVWVLLESNNATARAKWISRVSVMTTES